MNRNNIYGIKMLSISAVMMGKEETIYPTLLWDEDMTLLVDTGYPGQLPLIREAICTTGKSSKQIAKIVITHQDLDHIGSLPDLIEESDLPVEVCSSTFEQPYIQGERPLLKLTPEVIAQAEASLPPELPEHWRQAFLALLKNPPHAEVHRTLHAGEYLPYCGGITAIHTPGHTPGHISLYHHPSKTLIAGDAMVVVDGELFGPDPRHTLDMNTALQSLTWFTQYDIDNIICYHGGLYSENVNERIAQLACEAVQ